MNAFKSVVSGGKFCLLLAVIVAIGCSKLNQPNYDTIQVGMTQSQVEAILGPGKEQSSTSVNVPGISVGNTGGTYVNGTYVHGYDMNTTSTAIATKVMAWQDGSKVITLTFQNDHVISKAQAGL
jgi:hypothetical protein